MKKIILSSAIALLSTIGSAQAGLTSYSGTSILDSDVIKQDFTLASNSDLVLWTDSWKTASDADPYLTLFYGDGNSNPRGEYISENDDYLVDANISQTKLIPALGSYNSLLSYTNLAAGNYFFTLTFNQNYIAAPFNSGHLTNFYTDSFVLNPLDTTKTYANYNWNVNLETVNAVPVPAAVWLFGSALLGFMGLSRRKIIA